MGMIFAPLAGALGGGLGGGGLLGIALNVGQSLMQFSAQNAAAEAQAEYQRRQMDAVNREAERRNAEIRQKEAQEQESINRKKFEAGRDLTQARATAKAAATEGGVSGISVDALINDFNLQTSLYRENLLRQSQFTNIGADLQQDAVNADAAGRIASINRPIEKPSFGAAALRIGGNILGGIAQNRASRPGTL